MAETYTIERNAAYLSHLPMLAAAMNVTSGPVLELGTGLGSTYLLHGLCGATGRKLVSLESDGEWLHRFLNYGRPWHELRKVDSYLDLPEYREPWGMAFVDHGLYQERGHSVLQLRHVPLIVVHDTCYPWLYGYTESLAQYRYRWDWKVNGPQTTVISDTQDVRQIFARMGL